jgi:hexokinase
MKTVDKFLSEHKLRSDSISIQQIVDEFTSEMLKGLEGKESSLRMIPTYIEADNKFLTDVPVVAIDAGGTNFRAAIIKVNNQGKLEMSNLISTKMPGLEGEISKEEFFQIIAGSIKPLAEKTERIGFCFSYPTEILPDKDGILLQFCKEVQAPGVVGQLIGKNLLETLGMQGHKIVLLNDTVSTLLAGKSASLNRNYDSFIGYILGTGTNTCYIESNLNISKKHGLDPAKGQIINIESGSFGKSPRTDLDILFDNTTVNPGSYTFEKMISGGYFGGLCFSILKAAANEKVFSEETAANIMLLNDLSSEEVNNFTIDSSLDPGPLTQCITGKSDKEICSNIIESLTDRAGKLVAANLAAVILKTGKGKSPERPVLITVEGTTFYKLYNLRSHFERYFSEYLSGDRKRYYEITEVQHSSLVGAALAAMIN